MINLDANECWEDMPPELKARILLDTKWNRYPDRREENLLAVKLSEYTGWPEDGIVLTNGADEAILLITLLAGKRVVVSLPGFEVPAQVAGQLGKQVVYGPPAGLTEMKGDLVWLISPHNPMGFMYRNEDIVNSTKRADLVAVDATYWEFSGTKPWQGLPVIKNLLYVGSFSKAWALAGLRLGYILAPEQLARRIKEIRLPFPVNCMAISAGLWCLDHTEIIEKRVAHVRKWRKQISQTLRELGLRTLESLGNFVSFEAPDNLDFYMREKGIVIRKYPGLYRVSVGNSRENTAFIRAIRSFYYENSRTEKHQRNEG